MYPFHCEVCQVDEYGTLQHTCQQELSGLFHRLGTYSRKVSLLHGPVRNLELYGQFLPSFVQVEIRHSMVLPVVHLCSQALIPIYIYSACIAISYTHQRPCLTNIKPCRGHHTGIL